MNTERCRERYYPPWSSRGMRAVDCQHPAKWLMGGMLSGRTVPLCGTHKNRYARVFPERTYTPAPDAKEEDPMAQAAHDILAKGGY